MIEDAPIQLDASNFEEHVLRSTAPVLVDFWAPWCAPCRAIAPVIDAVAKQFAGRARVAKVNVDASPALAQRYDVHSIPALVVFHRGVPVAQAIGAMSREAIANLLARSVDEHA